MIRKAIIVVLSLAAVGTIFLWVDSYRIRHFPLTAEQRRMMSCGQYQLPEVLKIPGPSTRHYFSSNRKILRLRLPKGLLSVAYNSEIEETVVVSSTNVQAGRFGYESGRRYWPSPDGTYAYYREQRITVPLWLLLALFAAYPVIAFIHGPLRRWRRHRKRLCVRCGYDLTGNVSGICPECGTEVKQP